MSNPSILWAQDRKSIFVTLEIENIREQNINFELNKINFVGKTFNNEYDLVIDLFGEIDINKSSWSLKQNNIKFILKKIKNIFWNRLTIKKQNNVKIDWSKWTADDEDESSGEEENMINDFNDFKKNIPSEKQTIRIKT